MHLKLDQFQFSRGVNKIRVPEQYLEAVEGLLDTKKEALDSAQQLELLTGLTPPLASTMSQETKP